MALLDETPRCPTCNMAIHAGCIRFNHIAVCNTCGNSYCPDAQVRYPWCNECSRQVKAEWNHYDVMTWYSLNHAVISDHESDETMSETGSTQEPEVPEVLQAAGALLEMNAEWWASERSRRMATAALEQMQPTEDELRYALWCIQNPQAQQNDIVRPAQGPKNRGVAIKNAVIILQESLGPGEEAIEQALRVIEAPLLYPGAEHGTAVRALRRLRQIGNSVRAARAVEQRQGHN